MRIDLFFIWRNLNPLHPRMLCAKIVWNWISGSENFLNSSMFFFLLFLNYLSLEKGWALQLKKLKFPSPKDDLCQVWLKLAQWFWRRRFLNFVKYLSYFIIISPWKRVGPIIWTNLNPLHPRMLCATFGWNWLSGTGEEDFLNFVNVFSLFRNYLPLEKGRAIHLNKLESPLPKDALYQVWLKLAQWFWRRRFLNFVKYFQ